MPTPERWPALPLADWEQTYRTLHMFTQVVGKVRLAHAPHLNHWWQVPLYVCPLGLTTSPIPVGDRQIELTFDFHDHELRLTDCDQRSASFSLADRSVADFYRATLAALEQLDASTRIWPMPVEIANPVRFDQDDTNYAYDRDAVARLHRILISVNNVFQDFRGRFIGKSSPVHFFWGAFDLAVTRFSGRPNPNPPGDPVMFEGYSHELISHGWWPGGDWPLGGRLEHPAFYAYAVPEPSAFRTANVRPQAAEYREQLGEYVLDYNAVRQASEPAADLMVFCEDTYAAGAAGQPQWSGLQRNPPAS